MLVRWYQPRDVRLNGPLNKEPHSESFISSGRRKGGVQLCLFLSFPLTSRNRWIILFRWSWSRSSHKVGDGPRAATVIIYGYRLNVRRVKTSRPNQRGIVSDAASRRGGICPEVAKGMDVSFDGVGAGGSNLRSIVSSLGGAGELEYDLWEGQFAFSDTQPQLDEAILAGIYKSQVESLTHKVSLFLTFDNK